MTRSLQIKDVAAVSGFSANTLRYYEQIGLLPPSEHSRSGYRIYDQRTVDRLAFISHSKQLGCTLEEITGLTTAWDGGQCGPIPLERHRPDGPCDADCGCVSEHAAGEAARVRSVALTTKPLAHDEPAIACTLAAGSMKGRVEDWQALLSHVERREPIEGGIRSVFAKSVAVEELIGLVAADIVTSLFGASA